ncbi:MAG: helix-turn-helix transcriptional regulator [Candidatus Binatia bacterium]|nr:helix-turn-helix transcriptional regulator [Candidatus Binatia bacterium]
MQRNALGLSNNELEELARRVAWLRKQRGWTQAELAERCSSLRSQLFPPVQLPYVPHIRRDRIAKIELMANNGSGRTAARLISEYELRLLAAAFGVEPCWLRGGQNSGTVFLWELSWPDAKAQQFAELIAYHEARSCSRWVWSEPLPCTLQAPAFSERYFAVRAASWAVTSPPVTENHPAVAMNAVATANRERTLQRLADGSLQFFAAVPIATVEAIVAASDTYGALPRALRRECLEWALEQIRQFPHTLHVVFLAAANLVPFRFWTHCYESHYVSGGLSSWSDRSGATYFAENTKLVKRHLALVQAIYRSAAVREPAEVRELLQRCVRSLGTMRTSPLRSREPTTRRKREGRRAQRSKQAAAD